MTILLPTLEKKSGNPLQRKQRNTISTFLSLARIGGSSTPWEAVTMRFENPMKRTSSIFSRCSSPIVSTTQMVPTSSTWSSYSKTCHSLAMIGSIWHTLRPSRCSDLTRSKNPSLWSATRSIGVATKEQRWNLIESETDATSSAWSMLSSKLLGARASWPIRRSRLRWIDSCHWSNNVSLLTSDLLLRSSNL